MLALMYLLCAGLATVSDSLATKEKRTIDFAADFSINATSLFAAAQAITKVKQDVLATFATSSGNGKSVDVFGDWENLNGVSAIHYIASMEVDCDGVDFSCPHNMDGDSETSFGHLDASRVPYYVILLKLHKDQSSKIEPNALGAVVRNEKIYYGIFGDENGDDPEVIGEASILMAQVCFPNSHLDGSTGHDTLDVLYIIFGDQVPSGVGDKSVDLAALKTLGDEQLKRLINVLGV